MAFIKFDNLGSKLSNKISLHKAESFGFAAGFFKKYALGNFNYVTLFFDPDGGKIGFQFLKEKTAGSSFKIIKSSDNKSGSVGARSFFRTFNIDSHKYEGKYDPVEHDEPGYGKIFYIVLKSHDKSENDL